MPATTDAGVIQDIQAVSEAPGDSRCIGSQRRASGYPQQDDWATKARQDRREAGKKMQKQKVEKGKQIDAERLDSRRAYAIQANGNQARQEQPEPPQNGPCQLQPRAAHTSLDPAWLAMNQTPAQACKLRP